MIRLEQVREAAEATGAAVHSGYPATDAQAPFITLRPGTVDPELAISGDPLTWDSTFMAYCSGASVEASFNLAILLVETIQVTRVGGEVASCNIGYVGALIEGLYDTQVTIQFNQ